MIKTAEYMSKPVITADKDVSVLDIVRLMNRHNIGSVMLMDGSQLAGIITERDVLRKVISQEDNPAEITASDIMTVDVQTVQEDASVMEISGKMKEHTMRRIVVVDDNNKPIGIVTSRDLIGLLV
jgi:CBS domain-containing protein